MVWFDSARVQHIEWYGVHYLRTDRPTQRIIEWVRGQRLYTVRLDPIVAYLRRMPVVEHVIVRKVWPDRLQIHVIERQPFALMEDDGGLKVVDRHGVPFMLFQGDPGGLQWQPILVRHASTDVSFTSIRALITVLRERHPWLLTEGAWLHMQRPLDLEIPQMRVHILFPAELDRDESGAVEWFHRRLNELREKWPWIRERLMPQRVHEIDLRYEGRIYLRERRNGP